MKKRIPYNILFIGLILLVFTSCNQNKSANKGTGLQAKEKIMASVDGFIVTPSVLVNQITVSGSLLAYEQVDLMNEITGRVVFINLPEGKFVAKGTLLVKLFDDDLQADLKKLQTQLVIQQKILDRQTELLKVNGISQSDYDQTSLQVNTLKADIEVQQSLMRKTQILAPFDGVIGLRNISIGAQVTPSTLLATIREENKLKLDFSVPEKYSSLIKTGLQVKFTINENGKDYDATVFATEGGIDQGTRNLKVRALVNTKSDDLVPGSFATVELALGEDKNAMMIPTQAIIPKERNKNVIVAKNGKAHFAEVHTGIRQASEIQIKDGLQPGDTIVTNGLLFLKEGVKLTFATITSSAL